MTNEEMAEETTSAPEEQVEAAPVEEPAVEEAPVVAAPAEEAKCPKCGGPLGETGKCPVCDVEAPAQV